MPQSPDIRLRTARIGKGYPTAKFFAEKYGLAYTTYIKHESGKLALTEKAAKRYSEILSVPINWLLTGETIDDTEKRQYTTSRSLKNRVIEPALFPFALASVSKAIGKFDEDIDYHQLYEKCKNIISQILTETDDIERSKDYIMSISTMHSDELKKRILKEVKK
ncbi:helix-turn-helix transcriptional regulator [Vibrio sp.]|uniref:helix-turn-helix domain-containing protein n=1 Tax=Vibrio sp. TaxID=678 RepID=UPI00311F7BD3